MTKKTVDRTIHLVDIENLAGCSECSQEQVLLTANEYLAIAPMSDLDQVVLAVSHHNSVAAFFGWPTSATRLCRSGENGADLALLEAYDVEELASKFTHVVIGSGDGIFTSFAARLAGAGCQVTVVCRPDSLHFPLRLAAHQTLYMSPRTESENNHAA